jgi:hypothetical protein
MAMEPTPHAPPMIRMDGPVLPISLEVVGVVVGAVFLVVSGCKDSLSYRASQAVIVVRGIAAASSKLSELGFLPTIRSSTR